MRTGLRNVLLVVNGNVSLEGKTLPRMAPNLAESQHAQIRDMILSNCPPAEIADVVGCSERSVFAIQSNLHHFGSTKAPSNGIGRPRRETSWCTKGILKPNKIEFIPSESSLETGLARNKKGLSGIQLYYELENKEIN
jgi:hypothetical protein